MAGKIPERDREMEGRRVPPTVGLEANKENGRSCTWICRWPELAGIFSAEGGGLCSSCMGYSTTDDKKQKDL